MPEQKTLKFPDGFFWGAANSAHQVEGGNVNDWTEWEKANAERLAREAKDKWESWQQEKFPEMFDPQNYISGRACDHYNRFEEDFDLARSLGHNAHRFSIEWSRIEPEKGKFSNEAIEHYRRVLLALRERGLEPFVTMWHWTNPLWIRDLGGVEDKNFPCHFAYYAKYLVEQLGSLVRFWFTLNEPTSVIVNSYQKGNWPPQKKSFFAVQAVYKRLAEAHNLAYDKIHKIDPAASVGIANILNYFKPQNINSGLDKIARNFASHYSNERFLNLTKNKHDFLTAQYYFYNIIKFPSRINNKAEINSDLGWGIRPEGLYYILKDLKKYNLPIYVTENGLADAQDSRRKEFIRGHLKWIHKAMEEGVDVRGYFYWSLLDNFEWDKGFWPRFGLVEVDYQTLERTVRPSALEYAKICRENFLEI